MHVEGLFPSAIGNISTIIAEGVLPPPPMAFDGRMPCSHELFLLKSGTPPVAISLYSVTNTASVLPSTIEKTFAQPEALAPALLSLAKPYPQAFILGKSAVISL